MSDIREKFATIRQFYGYMKPYRFTYAFGIFMYAAQSFFYPFLIALFFNQLSAAALQGDVPAVTGATVRMVASALLVLAALAVGMYFYTRDEERATLRLKTALFRAFARRDAEDAARSHSGEGIAALNTEANTALGLYGEPATALVRSLSLIALSAAVLFVLDYRLGLLSLVIGVSAYAAQARFAKPLGEIGEGKLTASTALTAETSNILSGAATLRAFNLQDRAEARFDLRNTKLLALSLRESGLNTLRETFGFAQNWLSTVAIFGLGGYMVAVGELTLPALLMLLPMGGTLASGISMIGGAWAGLQANVVAARRVLGLIGDSAGDEADPQDEAALPADLDGNADYTLKVEKLSFTYRGAESPALTDVSLSVAPNRMVAFVGSSGCGKSTLLRAMLGLYGRQDFRMTLGGLSIARVPVRDWRRRFAYVDQSCKLFDMTVGENIALGLAGIRGEPATDEEIRAAAKLAGALDFINALPKGFGTPAGELGAFLSGGQKQRIAIARALVRKAPVLVFDEATSALDAESERMILETVESLRRDHTILIVTHHLAGIANADEIVVMENGRVTATGTYEQLLEKSDIFKKLAADAGKKNL